MFGGVIPEQVTAGFVVFALAVSWRPPLHEVIANRVTGYLSYSAALYISGRAKLLSHSLRFLIGVVMPIVITAVLELRAFVVGEQIRILHEIGGANLPAGGTRTCPELPGDAFEICAVSIGFGHR